MPVLTNGICLTIDHELGDNEDGLLGDHGVEPHQSFMLQLLHQVGLLQEGLGLHRSLLQRLDSDLLRVLIITCGRDENGELSWLASINSRGL